VFGVYELVPTFVNDDDPYQMGACWGPEFDVSELPLVRPRPPTASPTRPLAARQHARCVLCMDEDLQALRQTDNVFHLLAACFLHDAGGQG
jgi:hypothetical protein